MSRVAINRNVSSPLQNSGAVERINYRFYDTVSITNGLTTNVTPFATPALNDATGNFEGTGAMPAGQAFEVYAIRAFPNPSARADDVAALLNAAVLTFTKENSKRYAMGPLYMFPAGMGLSSDLVTAAAVPAAPANSLNFAANGVPVYGNVYSFKMPVVLYPQQSFKIVITPGAPVLAATITLRIILEGVLSRNLI